MGYVQARVRLLKEQYSALRQKEFTTAASPYECYLPMKDGVSLRTVIYKPVEGGPFPTILMRSCYPADESIYQTHGLEYSKRGFAFVYQYCRGTGGSEGKWTPNIHERDDGYCTLQWMEEQPWIDCIGYYGCSYLALTGWAIADIATDKVKTLYLTHYGTDRFVSAYASGCFRQDVLTSWAMENAGQPVDADFYESAAYCPQIRVDEDLWGCHLPWYRDWISHTDRSDSYWNKGFWHELQHIPEGIQVPVYIGEGWYDHHLGSALRTWQSLSERSRAHSTLRIGAWNHDFGFCTPGMKTEHLENNDVETAFRWFTTLLKKKQLPKPQISVYVIGGDFWKEVKSFPFAVREEKEVWLTPDKKLNEDINFKTGSLSFCYNPKEPVRSHGGEALLYSWDDIGSLEQPPCDWRSDVISFTSQALKEAMTILGTVKVILYVSSDAEDTAFTAKLMEMREDGTSRHVRSGISTLAYRFGPESNRCTYTPGETVELSIDFWDIAWEFPAGAQLRLDISSSDFPQYSVHSNFAGIWSWQKRSKCARQVIMCGKNHPSRMILPLC